MLISDSYREQNKLLHAGPVKYGHRGWMWVDKCEELLRKYAGETVLDYGCGGADLAKKANFPVINYDPATFPEDPKPCDIVLCTDVLEHIEPEYLDNVLAHIKSKTGKAGYFSVNTQPDKSKLLPDGTNPHKIIKSHGWWRKKIAAYFTIVSDGETQNHYRCEVCMD